MKIKSSREGVATAPSPVTCAKKGSAAKGMSVAMLIHAKKRRLWEPTWATSGSETAGELMRRSATPAG